MVPFGLAGQLIITILFSVFSQPISFVLFAENETGYELGEGFPVSLARAELKFSGSAFPQQSGYVVGQNIVVSSTVDVELVNATDAFYVVQVKDADDIVQFIDVSVVHFPSEYTITDLNSTWVPQESGIYNVEVLVLKQLVEGQGQDLVNITLIPIMEKGTISSPVFVGPAQALTSEESPEGISLVIEKIGTREFYQDRKVFLPTDLAMAKTEPSTWQLLAWPSIGPDYVISSVDENSNSSALVFDYYASLGIDPELSQIRYGEFIRDRDLGPPPQQGGRYFGFDWNQTYLDGTKVEPGKYSVYLTMPVIYGDISTGDEMRSRAILRSEHDYFTILQGPSHDLTHDLSVSIVNLTKTNLQTEEPFGYSVVLINNSSHTEYLTVDSNSLEMKLSDPTHNAFRGYRPSCVLSGSGGIAYASYFIHEQPLLPHAKIVIEDASESFAPNKPGTYTLAGPLVLSIADEPMAGKTEDDGIRASCLEVNVEPVTLNVTATKYDRIKLMLGTDKVGYERNETVRFSLYIENNSDEIFRLRDVSPTISVRNDNGTEIFTAGYIPSLTGVPEISPHSVYRLDWIPLYWDQKDYSHFAGGSSSEYSMARPGTYLVQATFVSPYLESDILRIEILG